MRIHERVFGYLKPLHYGVISSLVLSTSFRFYSTSLVPMTARTVSDTIVSIEQSEGDGARVRRSIGTGRLRNLDPFLMLDEFRVSEPNGFPDHPHRGQVEHEDFAGHRGTIGPGDLQWMTAGRGIMHAEMPRGEAHGLQLWVNLPRAEKMCKPRYQELLASQIPSVHPSQGVTMNVIAGMAFGVESKVFTKTPIVYLDIKMEKNSKVEYPIEKEWNAFVYTLRGKAKFGAKGDEVGAHTTVVFKSDGNDLILIETTNESAHMVLIGGQPLNEPVVQYGPFVMTTQEEIQQAFNDFRSARKGFEKASNWHSSIAH